MAGKRVKMIKAITYQGTTVAVDKVGEIEAEGTQLNNRLSGQSSSGLEGTVIICFTGGLKVPISMERLSEYIADVPLNTPISTP